MKYKNPISGEVKQLPLDEFLALFDEDKRELIVSRARELKATHIVCYECIQMDSSSFGNRTAVMVGRGLTIPSMKAAAVGHLKDLPSQREYPRYFVSYKQQG